jgi:MFS family permease
LRAGVLRNVARGAYLATRSRRRWRARPATPTDHPRTSYRTRVLATRSQRAFFIDGLLAAGSDIAVVRFMAVYAIALGATNAEVGLIAVANGIAGLIALAPGAWLAERTTSRKRLVLLTWGGAGRLTILLMVVAPLVLADHSAVYALALLSGARWFMAQFSHAAWTTLLAEIVPSELRRFYISQRMLAMSLVTMVCAPLAGLLIRQIGGIEGFQWTFLLAAVLGFAASWSYAQIEESAAPVSGRIAGSTRAMLADVPFVRFALTTALLHTSTMIAGPFFVPYLVRQLGATPEQIGLLSTVEAGAMVAAQLAVGLLVVRLGPLSILRATMFALAVIPLLWLLASNPWETVPAHLLAGAAWAAYNVVSLSLLVEVAPAWNLPRYSATHQAMVIAASVVGPLIGVAVVARYGLEVTILISAAGRLLAGVLLLCFAPAAGQSTDTMAVTEPLGGESPAG